MIMMGKGKFYNLSICDEFLVITQCYSVTYEVIKKNSKLYCIYCIRENTVCKSFDVRQIWTKHETNKSWTDLNDVNSSRLVKLVRYTHSQSPGNFAVVVIPGSKQAKKNMVSTWKRKAKITVLPLVCGGWVCLYAACLQNFGEFLTRLFVTRC